MNHVTTKNKILFSLLFIFLFLFFRIFFRGYMIHVFPFPPSPPSPFPQPKCNSTRFYHISLITTNFHILGIHTRLIVQHLHPQQNPHQPMSSGSCFFFCVTAPRVLPLDVGSFLSHKSLSVVLDHCIATSGEVLYV